MLLTPTASDYVWQFQRLLPRGRVWHRGWGWLQAEALLTLMPSWVRLHFRANNLLTDAFPCTTYELLPEWEASLGLPDPCTGPLDTIQERVAAVCVKFSARGGQSVAYFLALAAALGFANVTITQYASTTGDPTHGFTWLINIYAAEDITWFRAGVSTAGEPLARWGSDLLECTIKALAPAHTVPTFAYPPGLPP
jgi:uncharacterized protein YmfQ (DUF2313 family)